MEGFLFFLFFVYVFFCLAGKTISNYFWPNQQLSLVVQTIIGYVSFTLFAFICFYLQIPFVTLIVFPLLAAFSRPKAIIFKGIDKVFVLILVLGIFSQLLLISPSGRLVDNELVFWSSHGHDGMWHIAVVNQIAQGFPLQNPIYAGERLTNYHYFFNIAPAFVSKYFGVSPIDLFFRFFPLFFSFLLGSAAYETGKLFGKKRITGLVMVGFVYFSGSFGYVYTWLTSKSIGGESLFWASQIHSSIGNPPQIAANIIFLGLLIISVKLIKKDRGIFNFPLFILLGTLAMFKIYAALAVFPAMLWIGLLRAKRMRYQFLVTSIFAGITSVLLIFLNTNIGGRFLIFEPWWFIRTMIVEPGRLNWVDLELRRQTFLYHKNYLRVLQIELIGLAIFIVGNLGTKVLGFFEILLNFKKIAKDNLLQMLIVVGISSLAFPLLFLQKGVAGNTSQTLQFFLLVFCLFSALFVTRVLSSLKNQWVRLLIVTSLILFSVPTQLGLLLDFNLRPALAKVTADELSALEFLAKQDDGAVLTPNYNSDLNLGGGVPHIWDWFDTAYVSALSNKPVYFSDYEQNDIMGYDINARRVIVENIFKETNPIMANELITQTDARYIYYPKYFKPAIDLKSLGYKNILSNNEVEIWEIIPFFYTKISK